MKLNLPPEMTILEVVRMLKNLRMHLKVNSNLELEAVYDVR